MRRNLVKITLAGFALGFWRRVLAALPAVAGLPLFGFGFGFFPAHWFGPSGAALLDALLPFHQRVLEISFALGRLFGFPQSFVGSEPIQRGAGRVGNGGWRC